jgi:tetratricopeptide (TPR) repeat protein
MQDKITHKARYYSDIFIYAFLCVSILSVYWQVLTFDFISFDDYMYVRDNPIVRQGITFEGIKWAFATMYAGNWHPLTWLSHMMDIEIFGLNPGMYHVMNVFIHMASTLLLFYCLRRMTGSIWKSAVVAFIFGLHPLHVESVAWISERKDVLSTFFWILTMLCYKRYIERRSAASYIAVAVCYLLGLMAKPMLVTLPFVLLLLDFWPLKRPGLIVSDEVGVSTAKDMKQGIRWSGMLKLIREKIPLLLIAGVASVTTIFAQKGSGAISNLEIIPLHIRLQNAIISYLIYMEKMVWPSHLAVFYPFPKMIALPMVIISAATLIALTLLFVVNISRFPYLIVGWLWYLGTLLPVIGIIQVGSQAMADRYTYVPLIGISIMIAWGLPQLIDQWRSGRYVLSGILCLIVPLLMWSTWHHTGYWKDNVTLFSHAIDVTKDNYLAHNSLGVALCNRGEFDAGINHYIEALRIYPEHIQALNNLGAALVKEREYGKSIEHFKKAIQLDPYFVNAHYNLGVALYSLGKVDEAIKEYQEVLQLNPQHSGAFQNIQIALAKQRKISDAIIQLNDALKTEPRNYMIHCRLAELYQSKGETKEAIGHYENALSINPGTDGVLHALAVLYGENGEYGKALLTLQKMVKLNPNDSDVYYNIACIYSKQGRVDNALKWLSEAVKKGFNNQMLLKTDPDLENIRATKFYKQIIPVNNQ